jgi:hypothetical protein
MECTSRRKSEPNQYRRPYNPQIMQRDKKNNDDQKIQTPLQNNYIEENQEVEDADEDLDIHLFGDEISLSHLTQMNMKIH